MVDRAVTHRHRPCSLATSNHRRTTLVTLTINYQRSTITMAKQLLFDDRARIKLQRGINTLADAVAVTMGPTGRNVIIDKCFGNPVVTKDGVTVRRKSNSKTPTNTWGPSSSTKSPPKPATSPATARRPRPCWPAASIEEGLRGITLGCQSDGRPPRDRKGGRSRHRLPRRDGQAGLRQAGDRPGRRHLGQQRPRDRQDDRRRDGEGRPRRRHHRRRRQDERDDARRWPRGCSSTRATSRLTSSTSRRR